MVSVASVMGVMGVVQRKKFYGGVVARLIDDNGGRVLLGCRGLATEPVTQN